MEELIKKLKEVGKAEDAFASEESLKTAAKELGYSDEEIKSILSEADFPLNDSMLEEVAGGMYNTERVSALKRPDLFYPGKK